jgi:adenosylcobinamide hydrolase
MSTTGRARRTGSTYSALVDVELRWRLEAGLRLPVLVVRFPRVLRSLSSAPLGGGLGLRRFALNAQVPPSYGRHDPDAHLLELAAAFGLSGPGVGMLTAADVRAARRVQEGGVAVLTTVGLGHPIRAAAPPAEHATILAAGPSAAGTINLVCVLPARLSDAALVNAVATATEAKVQALSDLGLDATGTATDAVCIACPAEGRPEPFGGPRSRWGAPLARAVHAAVRGC